VGQWRKKENMLPVKDSNYAGDYTGEQIAMIEQIIAGNDDMKVISSGYLPEWFGGIVNAERWSCLRAVQNGKKEEYAASLKRLVAYCS
jgi:hypothetical protein